MELSFKTEINGKPTFFISKIISSLVINLSKGVPLYKFNCSTATFLGITPFELQSRVMKFSNYPKRHSIIKDKKNRWGCGATIHFNVYNGYHNHQFAPPIEAKSAQKIEIYHNESGVDVIVDDVHLTIAETKELVLNEGFENVEGFINYFNKDFKGKIVHWTNLKY